MTTALASLTTSLPIGPTEPEVFRIRDVIYLIAGIFYPDNKLRLLRFTGYEPQP
jgi:hypothetical protein